tara:strand:+ start:352 stop:579 length:228 start_codon:yes stop_codon:yes gene_type:complete
MAGRVAVLRIVISRPLQFPTIVPLHQLLKLRHSAQTVRWIYDVRRRRFLPRNSVCLAAAAAVIGRTAGAVCKVAT